MLHIVVASSKNLVNIPAIRSLGSVLSNLERLGSHLDSMRFNQFALFNAAYIDVTRTIQHAINDNYFDNPKFIEKFIIDFASHYFRAVNYTVRGTSTLPLPWAKLNEYTRKESAPVFISLLLGANAHINNDLPQVLNKLVRGKNPSNLLKDILKIDKLLMESGKRIIGLFEENNRFLNFLKKHFQFFYYRPAMYTILYWRIRAWKNYTNLKKDSGALPKISRQSTRIANRLLRVAQILS